MGICKVGSVTFQLDAVWGKQCSWGKAVHNRRLILVSPFQQPRMQMQPCQIWKTVTTITLWALWKYWCNRLYDAVDIHLSNVLFEIWENLLAIINGQYDNTQGSQILWTRKGKSFFTYGKSCPCLQCQLKSLNGTIDFHGLFLEYQQIPTPSTKFDIWS